MPARGRPSSLTEERLEAAKVQLAQCPILCVLAGEIGITYRTIAQWLRTGKGESARRERGMEPVGRHDRHVDFHQAVKAAQAKWQARLIGQISGEGALNWQRLAWLLERCFPDHFADNRLELRSLRREVAELRKLLLPQNAQQ